VGKGGGGGGGVRSRYRNEGFVVNENGRRKDARNDIDLVHPPFRHEEEQVGFLDEMQTLTQKLPVMATEGVGVHGAIFLVDRRCRGGGGAIGGGIFSSPR
jgi:hypothetical protein